MLMKDPKKNIASIIVAKMGKKPEEGSVHANEEGGMPDNEIGIKSAAEELLHAIEAKHVEGVVSALKSFMDMCEEQEPYEEESSEQEPSQPE